MTRAALLLVVAVLTSACGAIEVAPKATAFAPFTPPPGPSPAMTTSPSPTPAAVAATPSATRAAALPVRAWDVPPRPGVAHLDAIVSAMVTGNAKALEPYLEAGVRTQPCEIVFAADARTCAPGVQHGTPAQFLTTFNGCHLGVIRVDPPGSQPLNGGTTIAALAQRLASSTRFLWMVTRSGPSGDAYTLYFLDTRGATVSPAGLRLDLDQAGIVRFGDLPTCGAILSEIPAFAIRSGATFLVAPPP